MKKAPYKIGTHLKHKETEIIIELVRYATQIVPALGLSIGERNSKTIPNFNYIYGKNIENGNNVKGLTRGFELLN